MAQLYQLSEIQVVHVANDETINNPEAPQQVLLGDQIVLNDGQTAIYQNNGNNQYQSTRIQKIACPVSEAVNAQGQHSQVIIQQRQQGIDHQSLPTQSDFRNQDTLLQLSSSQDSQQSTVQPTQHIFYNGDQILQPNTLVHHTTLAGHHQKKQLQQYSSSHLLQTQHNPQLSNSNQSSVAQQHIQMQPQQQIVYRMQTTQQNQMQQTQMLGNTHVLVQQSSGQPVLIPTHQQHQDIVIRSPMPQQRIVYPRVVYQSHQQSVMQTSPQHIQISSSPLNTQANIVQARLATDNSQTSVQSAQQHQNVLFHPVHSVPTSSPVQKPNQTVQISPQNQLSNSGSGTIRLNKIPTRGGSVVASGLYARIPGPQNIRPEVRPILNQIGNSAQKTPRPRGALAGGITRSRAPKQRGGVNMIVCRSPSGSIISPTPHSSSIHTTPKSQQAHALDKANPPKQIFRTVPTGITPQSATEYSSQLQIMQKSNVPKYRHPPLPTNNQSQARPASSSTTSSTNAAQELDLEDSIQAVIVKKEPQKPHTDLSGAHPAPGTPITNYHAKDDDDKQLIRTPSGCMTLSEYKKRNPTPATSRVPLNSRGGPPQINRAAAPPSTQTSNLARNPPKPQQQAQSANQPGASSVLQTSHNNYEIQTQHVLQNRSGQQMAEKDRNSAKMLVICVSGDQRLITFTLPRESCTVQDLLEQVGVPFDSNTTIQCVENPGANIDFVVTVGFSMQESPSELISRAEQTLQLSRQQESNGTGSNENNADNKAEGNATLENNSGTAQKNDSTLTASASKSSDSTHCGVASTSSVSSPTNPKPNTDDIPRKIIQGFLAVCHNCGVSGYDHARCERCKTIFIDPPKKTPLKSSLNPANSSTTSDTGLASKFSNTSDVGEKKREILPKAARGSTSANGLGRAKTATLQRMKTARRKAETEVVILTLSSDEEDDEDSNMGTNYNSVASSDIATKPKIMTLPLPFEPVLADGDENLIYADFKRDEITDLSSVPEPLSTTLQSNSVWIGCLRYTSDKPVILTSRGICIEAPLRTDPKTNFKIHIHKREVAKILAHFSPTGDSILVIYTLRRCANYIKSQIRNDEANFKLSGTTSLGPYDARRVLVIFNLTCEKTRNIIRSVLSPIEELSGYDKSMLIERAYNDDQEEVIRTKKDDSNVNSAANAPQNTNDIVQKLLVYPPGKGGIPITIDDYMCLATEQYLNDIIIDFYLKWVHNNVIPVDQREKTFIFSTFFYKRLTTMARGPHEKDPKQTAVQRRHSRVQNWTKNVNLFEKDFVIIPINEQSHWFLAIICFPNLKGPVTYDTNKPVELQQIKKPKNQKVALQIGNTTITPLSKRETNSSVLAERVGIGDDGSERDEAEGEDSDLLSEDSNIESTGGSTTSTPSNVAALSLPISGGNSTSNIGGAVLSKNEAIAIKQPLILIFDSLTGASRSRVVATLRNYLTCEYKIKMPESPNFTFNKDNMPGHSVKVPQQNNFTDCGLYVLQYVEQFFLDPIRDYKLPIKQLSCWFDTLAVTRKREDIANLLKKLTNEGKSQKIVFPDIPFPTLNGVLVEQPDDYNAEFEEDEIEDEAIDETDTSGGDFDTSMETEDTNTNKDVVSKPTLSSELPTKKIVFKRRLAIRNPIAEPTISPPLASGTPSRLNSMKIRKLD